MGAELSTSVVRLAWVLDPSGTSAWLHTPCFASVETRDETWGFFLSVFYLFIVSKCLLYPARFRYRTLKVIFVSSLSWMSSQPLKAELTDAFCRGRGVQSSSAYIVTAVHASALRLPVSVLTPKQPTKSCKSAEETMGTITGTIDLNDDWGFMREHLAVGCLWGYGQFWSNLRVISLPFCTCWFALE